MRVADPNYGRAVFPPALHRLFRRHGAVLETVPREEAVEMYRVLQALVARLGTKQVDRALLNEACEALDAFRKATR